MVEGVLYALISAKAAQDGSATGAQPRWAALAVVVGSRGFWHDHTYVAREAGLGSLGCRILPYLLKSVDA